MSVATISFSDFLTYLEAASYLANLGLLVVAIFALEQVRILKKDTSIRVAREASQKAVEYADAYLIRYVNQSGEWFKVCAEKGLSAYSGPVDFKKFSIPESMMPAAKARFAALVWLPSINQLEAIAAAFVKGVADERVGFEIIGRTFCSTVKSNYDLIAMSRINAVHPHYPSIVALYEIWSSRLSKAEIETVQGQLSKAAAQIQDREIRPLGHS